MESTKSENLIEQKAIGDLLCGYEFHIPPYQRGYRWTKQQVVDLCNDLLEYALRPLSDIADTKTFYSLQPLVVKYRNEKSFDVIDGQQRLTTIYILFRFLMAELGPTPDRLKRIQRDVNLYSIIYETRKDDTDFIADLGSYGWEERLSAWAMDIDIAHIYNAYQYMKEWLYPKDENERYSSVATCRRFIKEGMDSYEIALKLLTLLKNKKDTTKPEGNAQFIWYQLSSDKDAIEEFIVENKGKIGLSDTERIRALFLYREDKNNEVDVAQQISIAKDWDEIETTLQDSGFWSFISSENLEEGRISLLFQYINNIDTLKDKKVSSDLYRFYEQKFAEKEGNVAMREWERILEAFRMLKNWYKDAYLFNIIGLLTREGISLNDIAHIYYSQDVKTTAQFVIELNKIVNRKCLPRLGSEVKEGEESHIKTGQNDKFGFKFGELHLNLNFNDHKDKIRSLLLFLNILVLNEQIENHRKNDMAYSGNEYRFAFDLFDKETWDVEHIDSATTNQLKSESTRAMWIHNADAAIKHFYKKDYPAFLVVKEKYESGETNFETLHKKVIELTDIESSDEEMKNWIGNLTLLNANINRGYGNDIFAAKCMKIDEKVNAGAFVPVCTRMVFYKAIPNNENSASHLEWNFTDKKAYHDWMLKKIMDFKKRFPLKIEY
ncbi:MAG: DUF262 domain-containing protein [Muribaculaceae bacterium]|nr:DUF262 domain-containing protein [Muribaculaceae bacterium]